MTTRLVKYNQLRQIHQITFNEHKHYRILIFDQLFENFRSTLDWQNENGDEDTLHTYFF